MTDGPNTSTAPGAAPARLPRGFGDGTTAEERSAAAVLREEWNAVDLSVGPQSFWRETGRRYLKNKTGMIAAGVVFLLAFAAAIAPWLPLPDPLVGEPADRLLPIGSPGHLLGTDEQGRDMLSRLVYGGRLSLLAGFAPTIAATVIGTVIGVAAGLFGGWLGTVLMRFIDMLYAFPAILLAVALGAALGPGLTNTIIAVTIVYIAPIARVAETSTRRVVVQEFVEAARLSGAGTVRIARTQIVPNVLSDIIVYASSLVGVAMIIAASLSFLGLGSAPPTPEWGFMLNSMRGALSVAPLVTILPGLFIVIASVSFNFASDALRESMDGRL